MRVLWILNGCGLENSVTGGPVRFHEVSSRWGRFAEELEQELMTTAGGEGLCEDLGSRIKRTVVPASLFLKREPSRFFRFWSYVVTSFAFRRKAKRMARPDVVITVSDYFCDIIPALFFKRRCGSKWIAWNHHKELKNRSGSRPVNCITYRMQEWSFRMIARYADEIWTLATDVGDAVEETLLAYGMDETKIRRMENGVDYSKITATEVSPSKRCDVVSVGLRPDKGIGDILSLWREVCALRPNTTLRLVGGRSGADAVLNEIAKSECADLIFATPEDAHLTKIDYYRALKSSRIFLSLSRAEGWGIAICEGMAAGLPVVACDLPVYKRIYKDAVCGAAIGDYKAMAQRIVSLLNDDGAYNAQQGIGRACAMRYSWDKIARDDFDATFKKHFN